MAPELALVFAYLEQRFPGHSFGVIGSAVKDYDNANDIDVLVPYTILLPDLAVRLGVKYNGWDTLQGHLRRANIRVPGVPKKVQLLQVESAPTPHDHPNASMLSDGTILKPGQFFDKANARSNFRSPRPLQNAYGKGTSRRQNLARHGRSTPSEAAPDEPSSDGG